MTDPDYINEQGVKWWHEADLTRLAFSKGLSGVRVWRVEEPNGTQTWLLTDGETILANDPTLIGLGMKMDMLAAQRAAQ